MKLRHHFIITSIICLMLFRTAGLFNVLTVFAFGVLVDADHYLWYILKFKKFSISKAMKFFTEIKDANHVLLLFHCVEWFIPLFVLSMYFEIAWYAMLGFAVHISMDYLDSKFFNKDGRNLSLLGWYVKQN
jgi:hypothetical protein|tara:strand:+ start:242 stop:634 length:393 start_codon:yes stop_codon:yes gene_type:complete